MQPNVHDDGVGVNEVNDIDMESKRASPRIGRDEDEAEKGGRRRNRAIGNKRPAYDNTHKKQQRRKFKRGAERGETSQNQIKEVCMGCKLIDG